MSKELEIKIDALTKTVAELKGQVAANAKSIAKATGKSTKPGPTVTYNVPKVAEFTVDGKTYNFKHPGAKIPAPGKPRGMRIADLYENTAKVKPKYNDVLKYLVKVNSNAIELKK